MYEEYNMYEETPKEPPKRKRTGLKVFIAIASAVTLGIIAGVCCFGVNYFGNKIFKLYPENVINETNVGINKDDIENSELIAEKDIQTLTDKYCKEADEMSSKKEKEILSV